MVIPNNSSSSISPSARDAADKSSSSRQDTPSGKKVTYYYDHDVGNHKYGENAHQMKPARMRIVHNLCINYDLLDPSIVDVIRPARATHFQMTRFHTDEYIDFLAKVMPETHNELTGNGQRFLTGPDCPSFEGLFEFCSISAGGSIAGANRLNDGAADTCINWSGGLHHAKKREASGFCYVNDIVLGILELLRYHERVLYIDIDIHHGDGVEEAFFSTDRVMTASFHKFGDYFPGTGHVKDIGIGKGKNYAVNVPLRDGINDETYASIFQPVISHIMEWYRPDAVVLQCGADSLAGDKLGVFNLTMKGHADCVKFVSKFNLPLMVLGGGGYTVKNVAKTWTYETGIILGKELDENLPYNEYLEYFGPRYKLEVLETNMDNYNSRQYLDGIKSQIIDHLRNMPFAPSTQMQHVPKSSVGRELGIDEEPDSDGESSIDGAIRARIRNIESQNGKIYGDSDSDDDAYSEDDESSVFGGRRKPQRRPAGLSSRNQYPSSFYPPTSSRASLLKGAKNPLLPSHLSNQDRGSRQSSFNGEEENPPKKRRFFTSSKLQGLMGATKKNELEAMLFPHQHPPQTVQPKRTGPVVPEDPLKQHELDEFAPPEFVLSKETGRVLHVNIESLNLESLGQV